MFTKCTPLQIEEIVYVLQLYMKRFSVILGFTFAYLLFIVFFVMSKSYFTDTEKHFQTGGLEGKQQRCVS